MTLAGVRWFFSILVIPLSVTIVQMHSIPFWHEMLGFESRLELGYWWTDWVNYTPGVLASLALEVLAIWRWLIPKTRRVDYIFAIVVTCLLVAGPVIRTAIPLWKIQATKSVSSEEVVEAEKGVKYYEDLIFSGRLGWQEDLRMAREQLKRVREASKSSAVDWTTTVVKSVVTIAVLILLTLGIVTSLDSLSRDFGALSTVRTALLNQIGDGRTLQFIATRYRIDMELLIHVIKGGKVSEAFLTEMLRRFSIDRPMLGVKPKSKVKPEVELKPKEGRI